MSKKKTREVIAANKWFPIARTLVVRCCRCKMVHIHVFRLRKNQLEMKVI